MYEDARRRCNTPWIGYINADIILPRAFETVFLQLDRHKNKKLLVLGCRQNFEWPVEKVFSTLDEMEEYAGMTGKPDWPNGTDFFFHPARYRIPFPKFAIGRPYWDNWLMHFGLHSGWDVIDLSSSLKVLHPNHDYRHVPQRTGKMWQGPEGDANLLLLAGSFGESLRLSDIKLELREGQIVRRYSWFEYWLGNRAVLRGRLTTLPLKHLLVPALDLLRRCLRYLRRYLQAIIALSWLIRGITKLIVRGQPCAPLAASPRIVVVTHTGCLYGANRSLLYLIDLLAERGAQVSVVAPNQGTFSLELENRKLAATIVPIPWVFSSSPKGRLTRLIDSLVTTFKVIQSGLLRDCEVVYSNSSVFNIGAYLSLIRGVPHIWHLRELPSEHFGLRPDFGWKFQRLLLSRARRLLVGSRFVREKFAVWAPSGSFEVAQNIAYSDREMAQECAPSKRRGQEVVFGVVCRFDRNKRVDVAIRAFAEVAKSYPGISLRIYGDGKQWQTNRLKAIAFDLNGASHIHFMGFERDRQKIFASINCLLVTAPSEAFGRTTVEAMSAGVPVIGVRSGATQELVKHEETGLLFVSGSVDSLANEMKRILDSPELFDRLASQSIQWGRQHYLSSAQSDFYWRIFTDLERRVRPSQGRIETASAVT